MFRLSVVTTGAAGAEWVYFGIVVSVLMSFRRTSLCVGGTKVPTYLSVHASVASVASVSTQSCTPQPPLSSLSSKVPAFVLLSGLNEVISIGTIVPFRALLQNKYNNNTTLEINWSIFVYYY